MASPIDEIITLKPFVHKKEFLFIFSFYSFFEKKNLREFWCPPLLKPKYNYEKINLKKSVFLKRKIERKV